MITLCLSNRKNEKCGLKKYVTVTLNEKLKINKLWNEEFINQVHSIYIYIYNTYIILKIFKQHDCCKFFP
jgi:hypothetical protein